MLAFLGPTEVWVIEQGIARVSMPEMAGTALTVADPPSGFALLAAAGRVRPSEAPVGGAGCEIAPERLACHRGIGLVRSEPGGR